MQDIYWLEIHPSPDSQRLQSTLQSWGYVIHSEPADDDQIVIVADRPDPRWLPSFGGEVLWWVKEGDPEEVSSVLAIRAGWVLRQQSPLEAVREALIYLRQRDLGGETWLGAMLHMSGLDDLLRVVLDRAVKLSGAKGGAIWVRAGEYFYQRAGEGAFPQTPIPLSEAATLLREGQAWLLAPGEQMALLRLEAPKRDLLSFLAWFQHVEPLILNSWHLEESISLSFKDDLTVAQNRRCLEAELPRHVRSCAAREESIALIFLDVDNLKQINSRLGHPAGSAILMDVARHASRIIRAHDRLYRYGGDEFCILMPAGTIQGAQKLGHRLLEELTRNPLIWEGHEILISLSAGCASFPDHADSAESLIRAADQALLCAKREGKGRILSAPSAKP